MKALSEREKQVIQLTSVGLTSKQIGDALGLSVHTVNLYAKNARSKLGARSRAHAAAIWSGLQSICGDRGGRS